MKEAAEIKKIPCAVCRVLMPRVQDGVASPESEALVKAHLAACPACRALRQGADAPAVPELPAPDDGKILQKLRRRYSTHLLLLAFVGYLTASGAIAGSVDAAAVKTAKLAISRAIPVVGGILADASETVLAGAGVLRGTVGAAGMLVVLAICLTPFLHLGLHYLVYKAAAALCALIAQPRLSGLIDALGGAFGMVLGMTGAGALILLVSVASALAAVGGG